MTVILFCNWCDGSVKLRLANMIVLEKFSKCEEESA